VVLAPAHIMLGQGNAPEQDRGAGLSLGKHEQRLVLRFITLITARYNWSRDELCVGQREIARLWSCNERTVKRDMAKLRGLGWLVVKRQGARGRVTEYGVDVEGTLRATEAIWPAIGPDYVVRLSPAPAPTVVAFPSGGQEAPAVDEATEWGLAQLILHQQDPARFGAWLKGLQRVGRAGGRLTLRAPSRFHAAYVQTHLLGAVLAACEAVDDGVSTIEVVD